MAHPQGGSSSTVSRSNWNLEMLVSEERGKPEYPEKNLSEQGREPTTDSRGESQIRRAKSVQAEAWCERKFTKRAGQPLGGYL